MSLTDPMPCSHFHKDLTRDSRWDPTLRFSHLSKHTKDSRSVWKREGKGLYFHKRCCIILQVNSRRRSLEPLCPHPPCICITDQIADRNSQLFMSKDLTNAASSLIRGLPLAVVRGTVLRFHRRKMWKLSCKKVLFNGEIIAYTASACSRRKSVTFCAVAVYFHDKPLLHQAWFQWIVESSQANKEVTLQQKSRVKSSIFLIINKKKPTQRCMSRKD